MKTAFIKMSVLANLALLFLVFSCSTKPESIGPLDKIIVFADSVDWPDYKDAVKYHFAKELLMPVREPEYLIEWHSADEIEKFKTHKNVMFIARLDSELPISKEVNDLLNDDVKAGIRSGKYFYIPQHNTWARNQYVVFLVAPTKNDMIQSLYDKGELVSEDFRKSYYKRLKERMFKRFENEELEQYLAKHYPFTLRLPPDYLLLDESQEERYIWLRRLHPDRSLAVHWIPYNDTIDITYDWIVKQRNKLAEKIFHGDVVVEEESKLRELKFKRWQAKRLVGTWKNPELVIGGPFRSTVFVDKKTNYIFMIDFYVRAIGQRKRPYIDQLDVIAHTFRLATDKEEKTSL